MFFQRFPRSLMRCLGRHPKFGWSIMKAPRRLPWAPLLGGLLMLGAMLRKVGSLAVPVACLLGWAATARAQQPPLQPLPPPSEPAPAPAPAPAPTYAPYSPAPVQYQPAQPPGPYPAPPAIEYTEPPPVTHAPKYALWVGGRLSLIGFGGN